MQIPGLVLTNEPKNHFASDNNAPAHPAVIEAIVAANRGHTLAYGSDYFTQKATECVRETFGKNCEPFFVFTGTGANVLSMAALTRSYHAVICAEGAHLNNAECSGPEKFAGTKLFTVATETGKITVDDIKTFFKHNDDQHHPQPRVVSLTQSTDFGYCFTVNELTEISKFAHHHGMYVHMDGARLYKAAAALDVSLRAITSEAGVDVLSLGGTKNGLLGAEAVVFFNPELAEGFKYFRKQGMQLASKMRFLAVQFDALFSEDLWLKNARVANGMAKKLEEGLSNIAGVRFTRSVETNMVYCIIPPEAIDIIRKHYLFYVYDEQKSEVRLVTNYDTTEDDVNGFLVVTQKAMEIVSQS